MIKALATVTLHAGTHKTATTSFQDWMRAHSEDLRLAGITTVPLASRITRRAGRGPDFPWFAEKLSYADNAGARRIVFSHEALHYHDAEEIGTFVTTCGADRQVRYVLTVRHWTGYLPSRWQQNCRRRDAQSLPEFLDAVRKDPRHPNRDLGRPIRSAQAGGISDIRVLSYDVHAARGDLVRQVALACGLPDPGNLSAREHANTSLSIEQADLLRLWNGILAERRGLSPDAMATDRGNAPIRYFDLAPHLRHLMKDFEGATHLRSLLAETQTQMVLRYQDFAEWENIARASLTPFMPAADREAPFGPPRDRVLRSASIQVSDLPVPLARAMANTLAKLGILDSSRAS